jgi:hypothetical protein
LLSIVKRAADTLDIGLWPTIIYATSQLAEPDASLWARETLNVD